MHPKALTVYKSPYAKKSIGKDGKTRVTGIKKELAAVTA
jgi:hypothetical protein